MRDEGRSGRQGGAGGVVVEDAGGKRPFMRGILIHSLMGRGVSFEDAYRASNEVRDRLRERETVTRSEIAKEIREILGEAAARDDAQRLSLPAAIFVTGPHGHGSPFSKGILSQSLLAAAIEPNDAFDVARELERELLVRGTKEIERKALRVLTYETLRRRMGNRIARRYLVWRRFAEPERPVILLLGGPTGAGKTTLAVEVAHRLGISRVISTDSIRQIMRIMLSRDLVPAIHGSSYEAHRLLPGTPSVVEGFRAQASIVGVGVRAMMDRAVAENTSLILEGVSIVPGLIDLAPYAGSAHVIFLVVSTLDAGAYRERFSSRAGEDGARASHRYLDNLEGILEIQDYFLEHAEQYGVPIVDNESFDRSVLSILRNVTETLREQTGLDVSELL
jgi:2-phosphoglycerate kinase